MTAYKLTANSTTAVTLVEGNSGTDDSLDTNGFTLAPTSGKTPVSVNLTNAPAAGGIVITNSGTITATGARVIDVTNNSATALSTATGAKITLNNSGTIQSTGTGKGDLFRVNYDMPQGTVIVNNTGTMKSTINSNDSQAIRLGKVYTATQIAINNGTASNRNALIQTNDADAIRPGGVDPSGSNTAYGSSTITNYGKIIAQDYDAATQLNAINGIDIGAGQSATVDNYGTIIGDESGLGSDLANNSVGGALTFAPNYNVTNEAGGVIIGNNGAAIAVGGNSNNALGTATISNYGTITGQALGTVSASSNKVTTATGNGILVTSTATITNYASGVIQGSGSIAPSGSTPSVASAISIGNGTITNYGTIKETASASSYGGAAILVTGSTASSVTNYGTITSAAGLAITMGGGNDTVNLYTGGTVSGTINGGAGFDTLTLNSLSTGATGTINNVVNFEALSVQSGSWTLTDAETYANGVTIASGAKLAIADGASTSAAIVDNGNLTYLETGTFTKSEVISGSGVVVQAGSGTLVLTNANNSYSGGTTISSGTLDVTQAGAAGTGAITFSQGVAQVLDIEQAALDASGAFANTLSGIGAEDSVDIRGIGSATGATYDSSTGKLTISGGTQTAVLQLDSTDAPGNGYAYGVTSDGNGGTIVALDKVATVQNLTASPSNGYVMAGQTVTFTLTLSKGVTITGNGPVLNLNDGGTAVYDAADSTATSLIFTTTVASGQNANGLVITSVSNGGSAEDSSNVPVDFSNAINQAAVGPTVDTSAPTIAITSAGSTTNQPTQTVSGTVDTADAGTTVTVYEGKNVLATAQVQNDGSWTASINLSGNGAHTIFATDTDQAGNVGTSNAITYTLETNAPAITIASQGGLTNQPKQTVSGSVDLAADPQAQGTTLTITDGGVTVGHATVGNDGTWSTNVTLNGDGAHTLEVADTDQAGNTGYAQVTYTLDTTPPTVTINSAGGTTNQPTQTVSGMVDTADAGTVVTVYEGTNALGTATVNNDGSWAASITLTGDGTHTLNAVDTDAAGNTGTSNNVTYSLDTSAPTVTIGSKGGLTNQPTQTVSGTVDLADAGSTVTVTEGTNVLGTATVQSNGTWSTGVTLTGDGAHTLTASDTDGAGNTGTASVTYNLDTTAPTITIGSTGGPTNRAMQTVTGTVDTADAGTTVTLTEGNAQLGTAIVQADGTWSAGITLTGEGTHKIVASDTDAAGNTGSTSVTYTLDKTAPAVHITSFGGQTNQLNQTVNGTGEAGSSVTIYEGSTALGTATVGADGYFHAAITFSGNGTHTITAKDTDSAGNTGTSDNAVTYNVDTTAPAFSKGNLVISVSGDGDGSGYYTDNQASNITLDQITTDGTMVSQLVLPNTTRTVNGTTEYAISGEYGSSSEGSLQLSGDGRSIVIAGYGINAATYNAGGAAVYGNAAEAQSTSIQGGQYTAVARVIADIGADGTVDTSTALYNVYNMNNPRSVATQDGSVFYISGQGVKGDKTQGVFVVNDGSAKATAIYNGTDTRTAVIYNGSLYVSTDSKQGGGTANISQYGSNLPTGTTTPTILKGISQNITVTATNGNTINSDEVGQKVALDPNNFFFANANTLYVADGGIPKQGTDGDGGLQKWTYDATSKSWTLQYTLSEGLNLVGADSDYGTTGLIGLTGRVVGNQVQLYATNQTVGDLDQKYVFSITDQLDATSGDGESFQTIMTAAPDTNIRGISFAPSTAAPVVAITSNGGLTNDPTQTISGTVDTADAGTTVNVLDGRKVIGTATVNLDGSWSTDVTLSGDGQHVITAKDTDAYGNTGTSGTVTYQLDTTPPSVTLTGNGGPTNSATQQVSGTGEVGNRVILTDNGDVVGSAVVQSDGTWSKSIQLSGGEGDNTIVASETDDAGNTGTSDPLTFTLDTTAPSVVISSQGGLTNDPTQTVSGIVDTADAGTTVTVFDGTDVLGTATVNKDGSWSTNVTLSDDGRHVLTASDTDAAGNSGTSDPVTYRLDTTPPDVTISNTGGLTNKAARTISGTVDIADAGTTVQILEGKTVLGSAIVGQDGSWSANVTLSGDGRHVITAQDTDAAGNTGTSGPVTFTLDTTAPTVTLSGKGGLTNAVTQAVKGTGEAGTRVYITDNGDVIASTLVQSDGTWSKSIQLAGAGKNTMVASDTDAAGNTGTSGSVVYTLDRSAPQVAITSKGGLTNQAFQTVSGTVGTADAGTTVSVLEGTTVLGTATVGQDGTWSTNVKLSGDGRHVLRATDTDQAGNTGSSGRLVFTLDTQAPDVTIANQGGSTTQVKQTITGTGEAGARVFVSDNGKMVGSVIVQSDGSWSRTIRLGAGTNNISASETDAAGNTGVSNTVTYTLGSKGAPATAAAPAPSAAGSNHAALAQALFDGAFDGTSSSAADFSSAHHAAAAHAALAVGPSSSAHAFH